MFSSHYGMALLALLALSAMVAEGDIAAPETCSEDDLIKGFCLNCKTKAKCAKAGEKPVPAGTCTDPGEACTVLAAGVATCVPSANTECVCEPGTDTKCDPYDPNDSLLLCGSTGGTYSMNCSLTDQTCINGACGTTTTTTTTVEPDDICVGAGDGMLVDIPMCTTGAYCLDGKTEVPFDCLSGFYLDGAARECKPLPPDPCADCDGLCPDKSDCSKFHVCQGGVDLDEEPCDAANPIFDIDSNECKDTGICTENKGCTYGLTTVVATTTAIVSPSDGTSTGEISTSSGSDSTTSDSGSTTSGSDSTTSGSDSTTTGSVSTTSGSDSTTSGTGSTSRPSECTAANVGQRYPYEGNCKMYWRCTETSNGQYTYVEMTCLGEYVFNPNTGYCDLQSSVPDCVPPS